MPKVKAVCVSDKKGVKFEVPRINLIKDLGAERDFHAKGGERQVSLLAEESIQKMREKGLTLLPGAFGENIITEGIDLKALNIGEILKINSSKLIVTKIGKVCVERCEIYYKTGDCIMPREGVFAKVFTGGIIKPGDEIIL